MELSDEALMQACQRGNESALETLIRRYGSALLGYLTRMTCSREQAEDLFQETFVRVHTRAATFEGRGRFKAWLFSIATRQAVDFLRRARRAPTVPLQDEESGSLLDSLPSGDPSPSDAAEQAEQAAMVQRAIGKLPPRQRATLLLAYFEGLSYPDVAKTMGCSVGTVKTQMSRALHTLAQVLPDPAKGGGG